MMFGTSVIDGIPAGTGMASLPEMLSSSMVERLDNRTSPDGSRSRQQVQVKGAEEELYGCDGRSGTVAG
jgi:hypothetical protein